MDAQAPTSTSMTIPAIESERTTVESGDSATTNGSHSKVVVQFSDPAGLFEKVSPHIRKRLPLGNLHWKSSNRPLRAIENLDVTLERERQIDPASSPTIARRHQIPGLRQTPFVRVLLLRCDDKDQYKESVRKEAKDWVKSLGISASGKGAARGQERHDALEYIIVHVVAPGTTAASQPKSSKHFSLDATDSTDSVNSKSKWPGKSTSTVFDKLRADFASSSKAPFERVAQVRLVDPSKPSNALGPLEIEEQWQDLMDKFKSAILLSFDARVAQYEEDIREKESQRSLPGWNFCTFFILKEGLARGFENVGLLEDALQIYEELDAGLDMVVQDQAKDDYNDAANALLPFAVDLKDVIRSALQSETNDQDAHPKSASQTLQTWISLERPTFPWRLDRRDYQQMILTNQISALDFRVYIFTRQTHIMLRRAAVAATKPKSKLHGRDFEQSWDADMLAEIGSKSVVFMNLAARNLRQDLHAAWGGQDGLPDEELVLQDLVIGNLIASWKWACLLQTLDDCQIVKSFVDITSASDVHAFIQNHSHDQLSSRAGSGQAVNSSTSSSLGHDRTELVKSSATTAAPLAFSKLRIASGNKADLIFQAGQMFTMLRSSLLQLCRHDDLLAHLTRETFSGSPVVRSSQTPWAGIWAASLRGALSNEESALQAYRLLSLCACQCYVTADKNRTSRQLLFDLARLDAHNDDFDSALNWLDSDRTFLNTLAQNLGERSMLDLYVDCLRRAGREQELIQALLLQSRSMAPAISDPVFGQRTWQEIRTLCSKVNVLSVPLQEVFEVQHLGGYIRIDDYDDRAYLEIRLAALLPVQDFGSASVTLRCSGTKPSVPKDLQFTFAGRILAEQGHITLKVSTCTVGEGWYQPKELEICFDQLMLHATLQPELATQIVGDENVPLTAQTHQAIYLYPSVKSPSVKVSHTPFVDLSQKRSIRFSLSWGSRTIANAQVKLRPATAGVRLDLMSAQTIQGPKFTTSTQGDSVLLMLSAIPDNAESTIQVSYILDDPSAVSISTRVEIQYENEKGMFHFADSINCMVLLPISVNVQDIQQAKASYARFTIGPSRLVPISVIECGILDAESGKTLLPTPFDHPLEAFPRQPVSWTAMFESFAVQQCREGRFNLVVSYRCLDEVILETLLSTFISSLRKSRLIAFSRPCLNHFREQILRLWTEADIELATLTETVHVWSFEELRWIDLIHAFPKSERVELETWLRNWHEKNRTTTLSHELGPIRRLSLKVPPPQPKLVVTAEIQPHSPIMVAGQPSLATFTASLNGEVAREDIAVEVVGSDVWLVGGQRKLIMKTPETQSTLILIAQTNGHLVLPVIEVRSDTKDLNLSCELDNLSSAATVMVRPGIGTSTFGIDGEDDIARSDVGYWVVATAPA